MKRPRFYNNTKDNVLKIFNVLKEAHVGGEGYISVSEIARRTGLHHWTVSRTVDLWMQHFLDVVVPEELEQVGLKIKLVRLTNPNATENMVLRSMRIRI
jgi:DNA-binding IclR family transcriptional regulator